MEGSAAQCGINPQCISLHSLAPLCRTMTGIVGDTCSGAMLKRGMYSGKSRSRFQRTRMSLNSNVAVMRPHIMRARIAPGIVAGQSRLSIRPSPAVSSAFIVSSFNPSCYERDNGYKTHRAKRSCLLQAHYKNDHNLEGIRKRKQEAIWQSTFSFLPLTQALQVAQAPR